MGVTLVITNNVDEYTVERLKQMKASHEAKFTDIVGVIRNSIVDHTKLVTATYPSSLARYCEIFDLNEGVIIPPISEVARQFNEFADLLRMLPLSTRELLVILVERAEEYARRGMRVLPSEVELVTGLEPVELQDHLNILKRHRLARIIICDDDGDGANVPYIYLYHGSGINIWLEIKWFCEQTTIPLEELIKNLRFHLLD
jgi:hypothetical protein